MSSTRNFSGIYSPDGRVQSTIEAIVSAGEDTSYGGWKKLDFADRSDLSIGKRINVWVTGCSGSAPVDCDVQRVELAP